MNTDNLVFIWGTSYGGVPVHDGPGVTFGLYAHLFGKRWEQWDTTNLSNMPDSVRQAKYALVNIFHTADCLHIEQIRAVNPNCFIVGCVDPCLDIVLNHPEWTNIYRQLSLCDAIGGRTYADCSVYGPLLGKPAHWLPCPIGPTAWFSALRDEPTEDYLITLDHSFDNVNTMYNVLACAAIQKNTDCRVIYVAARDWTRGYADLAGLTCEWLPAIGIQEMARLTARARLCVDMYAAHAVGRHAILCAMVGTPCITSSTCADLPMWRYDATDQMKDIVRTGIRMILMDNPKRDAYVEFVTDEVERKYSFAACRHRLEKIMEALKR